MCRNNFKLYFCVFIVSLCLISCKSASEVINSADKDENDFICVEQGSDLDVGVPIVVANDIPIIEICPFPYEPSFPGETIQENPGKPGESYDNLFQPVSSKECDNGLLVIKTNVPEVNVSLNSRYVGKSDIGITGVTPRIYILGLSKDGYKEESLWISVGENLNQVFYVELEKE